MKIRSVGTQLFHADGRTDMAKLVVAFRKFRTRLKATNTRTTKTNHRCTIANSETECEQESRGQRGHAV